MDSKFYNYTQTTNELSYEPYFYDKGNAYAHLVSGIVVFIAGIIITVSGIFKDGIYLGGVFGGIFLLNGLYRLLVEVKVQLLFSKKDDALYKLSLLGKKKKIALSNIYDIITVSENGSYTYAVTNKANPGAKAIDISSFFNKSRGTKPGPLFFEDTILPEISRFIESDK